MSASLSALHPRLQPWARWLVSLSDGVTVTSTYRSWSEQYALWNARFTNPYPVAPPGRSLHQYGRAFDLSADQETLYALGSIWRRYGGRWSPSDPIHFEA